MVQRQSVFGSSDVPDLQSTGRWLQAMLLLNCRSSADALLTLVLFRKTKLPARCHRNLQRPRIPLGVPGCLPQAGNASRQAGVFFDSRDGFRQAGVSFGKQGCPLATRGAFWQAGVLFGKQAAGMSLACRDALTSDDRLQTHRALHPLPTRLLAASTASTAD